MIQYRINGSQSGDPGTYSMSTNTGLEILGGDLRVVSTGNYNALNGETTQKHVFNWGFNFQDNSFISDIKIGSVGSGGGGQNSMPSTRVYGIQITNERKRTSAIFTDVVYEDQIEPGWQVELYKDGFMAEHTTEILWSERRIRDKKRINQRAE
jgi:hypothetical protein